MSPVELSDGTIIMPGNTITMPAGPMARDQSYYDDPLTFDRDRFDRSTKKTDAAQQSANVTQRLSLGVCFGVTAGFHALGGGTLL